MQAADLTEIPADTARQTTAERFPSGWWLIPAAVAGAGIWAALIWWAPAVAGVFAVAVGALALWGL